MVGELAAGHAQLIALRRVAVGAVPCEVLKSDLARRLGNFILRFVPARLTGGRTGSKR